MTAGRRRDLQRERVMRLLIERLRTRPRFLTVPAAVTALRALLRHALPGPAGSDCVLWGAAVNNDGYGKLSVGMYGRKFQFYAHRLAAQFHGHPNDIPKFREVAHRCNTPACFSPLCVEIQRRKDNRRASAYNTHQKIARRKLRELRLSRERREQRV